jgi:ABC-type polysaccharide/polyol phosphate export permease
MLQLVREAALDGWMDLRETIRTFHRAAILGWQEVATRYRRSRVGPFWLTINKAVLIAALSFVFGTLFRLPMDYFIPYLAIGLVLWGFIASTLGEGCTALSSNSGTILHVRMPLTTYIGIVIYRNILILLHNALIIPVVLLIFWRPVSFEVLLVVPGLLLLALNLAWMILILSVVCARYRDVTEIVNNALQVVFYLTPIIWTIDLLEGRVGALWLQLNPLLHLIEVVRAPLLGEVPSVLNWSVVGILALVGWAIALPFFGRFQHRVPYWL